MRTSLIAALTAFALLSSTGCSPSRKELAAELDKVKDQLAGVQSEVTSLQGKIKQLEGEIGLVLGSVDLREVEEDRRTTTGNVERRQYLDSKIAFISEEISLIRRELNRH